MGLQDNDYSKNLLAKKDIHSFANLPDDSLKIIASDITNGRMIIVPDSLDSFGMPKEKMSVAKAIKMSCSFRFSLNQSNGKQRRILVI